MAPNCANSVAYEVPHMYLDFNILKKLSGWLQVRDFMVCAFAFIIECTLFLYYICIITKLVNTGLHLFLLRFAS